MQFHLSPQLPPPDCTKLQGYFTDSSPSVHLLLDSFYAYYNAVGRDPKIHARPKQYQLRLPFKVREGKYHYEIKSLVPAFLEFTI